MLDPLRKSRKRSRGRSRGIISALRGLWRTLRGWMLQGECYIWYVRAGKGAVDWKIDAQGRIGRRKDQEAGGRKRGSQRPQGTTEGRKRSVCHGWLQDEERGSLITSYWRMSSSWSGSRWETESKSWQAETLVIFITCKFPTMSMITSCARCV